MPNAELHGNACYYWWLSRVWIQVAKMRLEKLPGTRSGMWKF